MIKQSVPANDTDASQLLAGEIRDLRRELVIHRRSLELLEAENTRLKASTASSERMHALRAELIGFINADRARDKDYYDYAEASFRSLFNLVGAICLRLDALVAAHPELAQPLADITRVIGQPDTRAPERLKPAPDIDLSKA